jgi:hypothetical protein
MAADSMVVSLRKLLNWMNEAVASDLEILSDKGKDRMFVAASGLLEKVNGLLLISSIGAQETEELVRPLRLLQIIVQGWGLCTCLRLL